MWGLQRLRNVALRAVLLRRARRRYERRWQGAPLVILPGVLDPVGTRVGAWLAGVAEGLVRPGERWVDMGCGSGVVALAMARRGALVTAVDIDPVCVANTRENAQRRGLAVQVVEGDHFAWRGGEEPPFDGVVYNVPFWPGPPRQGPFRAPPEAGHADMGRAMHAGEGFATIRGFAEAAPRHARAVYVALSEAGAEHAAALAALGPAERTHRERVGGEWLGLWRLTPPRG